MIWFTVAKMKSYSLYFLIVLFCFEYPMALSMNCQNLLASHNHNSSISPLSDWGNKQLKEIKAKPEFLNAHFLKNQAFLDMEIAVLQAKADISKAKNLLYHFTAKTEPEAIDKVTITKAIHFLETYWLGYYEKLIDDYRNVLRGDRVYVLSPLKRFELYVLYVEVHSFHLHSLLNKHIFSNTLNKIFTEDLKLKGSDATLYPPHMQYLSDLAMAGTRWINETKIGVKPKVNFSQFKRSRYSHIVEWYDKYLNIKLVDKNNKPLKTFKVTPLFLSRPLSYAQINVAGVMFHYALEVGKEFRTIHNLENQSPLFRFYHDLRHLQYQVEAIEEFYFNNYEQTKINLITFINKYQDFNLHVLQTFSNFSTSEKSKANFSFFLDNHELNILYYPHNNRDRKHKTSIFSRTVKTKSDKRYILNLIRDHAFPKTITMTLPGLTKEAFFNDIYLNWYLNLIHQLETGSNTH